MSVEQQVRLAGAIVFLIGIAVFVWRKGASDTHTLKVAGFEVVGSAGIVLTTLGALIFCFPSSKYFKREPEPKAESAPSGDTIVNFGAVTSRCDIPIQPIPVQGGSENYSAGDQFGFAVVSMMQAVLHYGPDQHLYTCEVTLNDKPDPRDTIKIMRVGTFKDLNQRKCGTLRISDSQHMRTGTPGEITNATKSFCEGSRGLIQGIANEE